MLIRIGHLDKARVLVALYNAAKPLGAGWLQYTPEEMSREEAVRLLEGSYYFDYLHGRVMKVDLVGTTFDASFYDRDNGHGAALMALRREGLQVEEV